MKFKEFLIGCCYYPEYWDDENMERDLSHVKDLGFSTVQKGEFARILFEKEKAYLIFCHLTVI